MSKEERKYSNYAIDLDSLLKKIEGISDSIEVGEEQIKISDYDVYKKLRKTVNDYIRTTNPKEVNQLMPKRTYKKVKKLEKDINDYITYRESGVSIDVSLKKRKLYDIKNSLVILYEEMNKPIEIENGKAKKNSAKKRFAVSSIFKFSGEFLELITAYIGLSIDIWQVQMSPVLFYSLCGVAALFIILSFIIDVMPNDAQSNDMAYGTLKRNCSLYLSFLFLSAYLIIYYVVGIRNLLLSALLIMATIFAVVFVCTFIITESKGKDDRKGWSKFWAVVISVLLLGLSAGVVTVNVIGEKYSLKVNGGNIENTTDLFVLHSSSITIDEYNGEIITSIGNNAFEGRKNLKTVYIGGGVNYIGANAFKDCTNLETIYVYFNQNDLDTITISPYAFSGCNKLKILSINRSEIDLPSSALPTETSIEDKLQIVIPTTVTIDSYGVVQDTERLEFKNTLSVHKHTVKYVVDGSEYVSVTQDYNSAFTVPENPSKTGYTFIGWCDVEGNVVTISPTIPACDMVLYVKWEAKKSIVRFEANGGTMPFYEIQVEYGNYTELPTPNYNSAHKFEGWYTDQYFFYKYNDLLQNTTQDTTLYAKWSDVILKVCESTIRTGSTKINGSGHYTENSFSINNSINSLKSKGYNYLEVTIYCPIAQQDYCKQFYYVYNNGNVIFTDQTMHSGTWHTYTFNFEVALDDITSTNFSFKCQAENALFRDFWIGDVRVVVAAKP